MQTKAWANEVRAFARFRSADGTIGVTATVAGIEFKNGLYTGGAFSGAGVGASFDHIAITGTAGNGWIEFSAQTVTPALGGVNLYATSAGRLAIGHSGTTSNSIIFGNDILTADRTLTAPDKNGTIATTGDNVSQFVNDLGYVVGPGGAVADRIATFNGTTGKLIKDSGIAASSVVLNTRTLSEGAGLAGNTYDLSANRTLAMGAPSTLGVASTNAVSGTTHSHAITSSSNPGTAAQLLSTDASGFLTLRRLTLTDYLLVNAATANIYLKDTSTGFGSAGSTIVTLQPANAFRSSSYTAGVLGYGINANGDAEFNNVRIRGELAASVFKVSEISATAGTFGVFYSAAALNADCTTPVATSSSFTFDAKNSDAGGMLFAVNDVVRFKSWTGAAVSDSWATITARTNHSTYTTYTATLNSGSTSATFRAGTAVVDYGPTGTGFITLSTDGTVGSSPNLTMATHAGSPWSAFTNLLRMGNLNGSYGYATDIYGLGIGDYAGEYLTVDPINGLRLNATGGNVKLDANGLTLDANASAYVPAKAMKFSYSGTVVGYMASSYNSGALATQESTALLRSADTTGVVFNAIKAQRDTGGVVEFDIINAGSANAGGHAGQSYAALYGGATFQGLQIGNPSGANWPTHMLDVYGTVYFSGAVAIGTTTNTTLFSNYTPLDINGSSGASINLQTGGVSKARFISDANSTYIVSSTTLQLLLGTSGTGTSAITINNTTSSGVQLNRYGAGTINSDASGNLTASSDEKLKTKIRKFRKGLETIKKLEPILYRWNKKSGLDRKNDYVGFGARHTKRHIPEAIGKGQDGFHTMSDRAILATVVNAIKELEEIVCR